MSTTRYLPDLRLALLSVLAFAVTAQAYDSAEHQKLTFLAAKHFNRCVAGTALPTLTPLEVRYMARSNVGLAESNLFARMFRWRYYDRSEQAERSFLWVVDTRLHEHFNELKRRLRNAQDEVDAYRELGRIIGYLQMVSSPARVVPVYTARFWRFSLGDRFDDYPIDEDALNEALGEDCSFLDSPVDSFDEILQDGARDTLNAVVAPIAGMPVTWEVFWKLGDDARSFGEYGPAGNSFGRRTEFRCDTRERCLLLKDDPLYAEFALQRHLAAVRSTLAAMRINQIRRAQQFAGGQ